MALMANASDLFGEAAWLDLCPGHDLDLRSMLIADPFLDDAKIIRRYEAWADPRDARDTS
jgi:hypothetical protein